MRLLIKIQILVLVVCCSLAAFGQGQIRVHTDFAYLNRKEKLQQTFFLDMDSNYKNMVISARCYKYRSAVDSQLVYGKKNNKITYKKGLYKSQFDYSAANSDTYLLPEYYSVVKTVKLIPPGSYKTFIEVTVADTTYKYIILKNVDSNLSTNSSVSKNINDALLPPKKILWFAVPTSPKRKRVSSKNMFKRSERRIEKLAKQEKLDLVVSGTEEENVIDVYCEGWYVGRYSKVKKESLAEQIEDEQDKINANPGSQIKNDIESYESLFSQMRKQKEEKKDNKEIAGQIGVSTNLSSGQEEYSAADNNYVDVMADVNFPIGDIPFMVEGLYTTQDAGRAIKSSYFRFRYDVDKAKDELLSSVNGFKQKYRATSAKSKGLKNIYHTYINTLISQRERLTRAAQAKKGDLVSKPGIKADSLKGNPLDSLNAEDELRKKENEIKELDQKIKKYQLLLQQYENTVHFDSLLVYDKVKDLENTSDLSYKEMAKKANEILPEGKTKSFMAGVTNLEAGIFPKYVSKYTVSGQTVKGLDLGYDVGFCEAGVTVGKTEYISRSGEIDKYSNYSGRLSFKPYGNQKIDLVYFGYTPNKMMLSEDRFFEKVSVGMPSFREPVHIISAVYQGTATEYVNVEGEMAMSYKKMSQQLNRAAPMTDRMAYRIDADGFIPETSYRILAGYEHTGKNFENDVMPISMAGTDKYRAGVQADFFRSFLTAGVEYNRLVQNSFSSKASNTGWGFEVKTNSRRYPSVYLAYKPFTTFRTYDDTFAIPQKPVFGNVLTGRVGYQIKKMKRSYRFQTLYTKNESFSDTNNYQSSTLQFSGIYRTPEFSGVLNIGQNKTSSNVMEAASAVHQSTRFVNAIVSFSVDERTTLSVGQDFGVADFGFSKYGALFGGSYRFLKLPLAIGATCRYNTYKIMQADPWKKLFGGSIDLIWQFKLKLIDKT